MFSVVLPRSGLVFSIFKGKLLNWYVRSKLTTGILIINFCYCQLVFLSEGSQNEIVVSTAVFSHFMHSFQIIHVVTGKLRLSY